MFTNSHKVFQLLFIAGMIVVLIPIRNALGNGENHITIREAVLNLKLIDNKAPYYWKEWLSKQPPEEVIPILTQIMQEDSVFIVGRLVGTGESSYRTGTGRRLAYELLVHHNAAAFDDGLNQLIYGLDISSDVRKLCFDGLIRAPKQNKKRAADALSTWIKSNLDNTETPSPNLFQGFRIIGVIGIAGTQTITFLRDLWTNQDENERIRSESALALLKLRGFSEFLNLLDTRDSLGITLILNSIRNYGLSTHWEFASDSSQWNNFTKLTTAMINLKDSSVSILALNRTHELVRHMVQVYPPASQMVKKWWLDSLRELAKGNVGSNIKSRSIGLLETLEDIKDSSGADN